MATVPQQDEVPEPESHLSHVIIQKQLQDVILTQQAAYEKLKQSINDKGETIPLKQYETVLKLLEDEQVAHAKTQSRLLEVEDKLEFALGEVEILNKQIEREKTQFEKAFGMLKNKALKETCKNVELENKCEVIEQHVEITQDCLSQKEAQIANLTEQLQRQTTNYEQQVSELNIQRMQDAYISQTLAECDAPARPPRGRQKLQKTRKL